MKCAEYQTYSVLCQECDITADIKCTKVFDFDIPLEAVRQSMREDVVIHGR